jgi:hypothetical protein
MASSEWSPIIWTGHMRAAEVIVVESVSRRIPVFLRCAAGINGEARGLRDILGPGRHPCGPEIRTKKARGDDAPRLRARTPALHRLAKPLGEIARRRQAATDLEALDTLEGAGRGRPALAGEDARPPSQRDRRQGRTAAFRSSITALISSCAGRISNGPKRTPGCFDIRAMAWFRSRASSRRMPPRYSFVSA